MTRRTSWSLHWLTLAVVLPLLLLAAFAWTGLEAQAQVIRNQMQEERLQRVNIAAKQLARELEVRVVETAHYPDPPIPGTSSPADGILDGTDLEALASVRDSPEAGYSPAGLPRRVLAALRLRELKASSRGDGGSFDDPSLVRLVTTECPSILTELALSQAGSSHEQIRWEERTYMASLLGGHPEGGWIVIDPESSGLARNRAWVKPGETMFRYLSPGKIQTAFQHSNLQGIAVDWEPRPTPPPCGRWRCRCVTRIRSTSSRRTRSRRSRRRALPAAGRRRA